MAHINNVGQLVILWDKTDVLERARERGKELTDAQAADILARMAKNHDCNIGINWDCIDAYTDYLLEE